jgi:pseudaminic acid biosynthesis-associated methylase
VGKDTEQTEKWSGEFGRKYTDRNSLSLKDMEKLYLKSYGVSRTEMNRLFLSGLSKSIEILEVGANIGTQLLCLQNDGFTNVHGIELQAYAVEKSKSIMGTGKIIQGSAFDIPYGDGSFDLVFTSGVLIHISPNDLNKVLDEIYRCSRKYIWGFEYYSDCLVEVNYRGEKELLWKTNFAKLYLERFSNLKLIKEVRFKYLEDENVDSMFILEKSQKG